MTPYAAGSVAALVGQGEIAVPVDQRFQIGHLLGGLGLVAAVGAEHGAPLVASGVLGVHQQRRVGTGETGQIADIAQIDDQQRVEAVVRAARDAARCGGAGVIRACQHPNRAPVSRTPHQLKLPAGHM